MKTHFISVDIDFPIVKCIAESTCPICRNKEPNIINPDASIEPYTYPFEKLSVNQICDSIVLISEIIIKENDIIVPLMTEAYNI